jgi:hypothetical protein
MSASIFTLPLSPTQQTMTISLSGVTYNMQFTYRDSQMGNPSILPGGWILDLSDADGDLLVGGIPLVTGCDLLAPYPYLGIGGRLIVATDGAVDAVPTYANLGLTCQVYYVPNSA